MTQVARSIRSGDSTARFSRLGVVRAPHDAGNGRAALLHHLRREIGVMEKKMETTTMGLGFGY